MNRLSLIFLGSISPGSLASEGRRRPTGGRKEGRGIRREAKLNRRVRLAYPDPRRGEVAREDFRARGGEGEDGDCD